MYYDELIENADNLSCDSGNNKQKVNNLLGDKRLFKVKRRNYEGRIKNIDVFASGPTGFTIRNAVTGFRYNGYKVGSNSEDLFFRVGLATGECAGIDGKKLFYDNPEQYENHMYEEIPQEIKEEWMKKTIAVRYNLENKSSSYKSK
jgi:hypothetical protein